MNQWVLIIFLQLCLSICVPVGFADAIADYQAVKRQNQLQMASLESRLRSGDLTQEEYERSMRAMRDAEKTASQQALAHLSVQGSAVGTSRTAENMVDRLDQETGVLHQEAKNLFQNVKTGRNSKEEARAKMDALEKAVLQMEAEIRKRLGQNVTANEKAPSRKASNAQADTNPLDAIDSMLRKTEPAFADTTSHFEMPSPKKEGDVI